MKKILFRLLFLVCATLLVASCKKQTSINPTKSASSQSDQVEAPSYVVASANDRYVLTPQANELLLTNGIRAVLEGGKTIQQFLNDYYFRLGIDTVPYITEELLAQYDYSQLMNDISIPYGEVTSEEMASEFKFFSGAVFSNDFYTIAADVIYNTAFGVRSYIDYTKLDENEAFHMSSFVAMSNLAVDFYWSDRLTMVHTEEGCNDVFMGDLFTMLRKYGISWLRYVGSMVGAGLVEGISLGTLTPAAAVVITLSGIQLISSLYDFIQDYNLIYSNYMDCLSNLEMVEPIDFNINNQINRVYISRRELDSQISDLIIRL